MIKKSKSFFALIIATILFIFTSCEKQQNISELSDKYLNDAVHAWITAISWANPEELPPDAFPAFYYHHVLIKEFPDGWTEPIEVTAEKLEAEVQSHFDVSAEHIKKAANYDTEEQVYLFDYGIGSAEFALTKAQTKDDLLLLYFEYYDKADTTKVIRSGILTLKVNAERFKYLACSIQEEPSEI